MRLSQSPSPPRALQEPPAFSRNVGLSFVGGRHFQNTSWTHLDTKTKEKNPPFFLQASTSYISHGYKDMSLSHFILLHTYNSAISWGKGLRNGGKRVPAGKVGERVVAAGRRRQAGLPSGHTAAAKTHCYALISSDSLPPLPPHPTPPQTHPVGPSPLIIPLSISQLECKQIERW